MNATRGREATWKATATEVDTPGAHLTVGDVANRTGLSAQHLLHMLYRRQAYDAANPMGALMRPDYRYGEEPRWSDEQLSRYFELKHAWDNAKTSRYAHLPLVTEAEARQLGLVSLRRACLTSGHAPSSMNRWQTRDGFPQPTHAVDTGTPTPRVCRPWADIRAWLITRHPDRDYPEQPRWDDVAEED